MSVDSVPDVGDLWHLANTFYSDAAETAPADPTSVTLTIRDPRGVIVDASSAVSRETLGLYSYDWTPLVGGTHEIQWAGAGDIQVTAPETIIVRSGLDQAFATTQYIQGVLGSTGQGNPDLIARLALVCSEHIMQHCDRRFLPYTGVASTKRFRIPRHQGHQISLAPWDCQAGQPVTIVSDPAGSNTTLVLDADYYLAPENSPWGIADRIQFQVPLHSQFPMGATWGTPLYGYDRPVIVGVTATWGWSSIPPQVAEACAYWVRDLLRAVSAYPQNAQIEDITANLVDGTIPAIVRQLLAPFRHMVVA